MACFILLHFRWLQTILKTDTKLYFNVYYPFCESTFIKFQGWGELLNTLAVDGRRNEFNENHLNTNSYPIEFIGSR